MTDDTVTPVDISDNLDDFENVLFEREAVQEEVEDTEDEAPEDDPLATETDDEDEVEDSEADDSDEEEEEPEPKPKPKNKTQERIEKLVAKTREQERREAELLRRIELLETSREKETPKDVREMLPVDAPNPDAKGEDGEPLYPLGEYDPKFIRDITKFTVEQEVKAAREAEVRENQQKAFEAAQQELASNWMEKLDAYEEVEPDIRENIRDLTDTFQSIDQSYGEYLASTIMMMESGPAIMNYLSNNIGEAQKIVASGPAAATLALGRLDVMLTKPTEEKRDVKRVSQAKEPPVDRTRGSGGKFAVADDTDDLNAFERKLFKKQ